jgi:uncharacterized membrane protein
MKLELQRERPVFMFAIVVGCADLLCASLLVGAMFGYWLIFDPSGLTAAQYIALQQHGIRGFNATMPVLGAATLAVTVAAAVMARQDPARVAMLAAASLGFLAAGLITRFLNQPINAVVMTWSPAAPPADWTVLRDSWWRWHIVRLTCGIGGLLLLIVVNVAGASSKK